MTDHQKPSAIIKEYVDKVMAKNKMGSCGIESVDILAKHVARLSAHADAIDDLLDTIYDQ